MIRTDNADAASSGSALVWILLVLVILQAIVIAFFATTRGAAVAVFSTQSNPRPIHIQENPLRAALEYESSDRKFEELVKLHPEFVTLWDAEVHPRSLIEEAAISKRTNFVRILAKHGASVRDAMAKFEGKDAPIFKDALDVLRTVEAEVAVGGGMTNKIIQ